MQISGEQAMKSGKVILAGSALLFSLSAHATLPPDYVGLWASEDSVFQNEDLQGGTALYLAADGSGAMVVAPLPVKKCGAVVCTPVVGIRAQATLGTSPPAPAAVLYVQLQGSTQPLIFTKDANTPILRLTTSPAKGLQLRLKTASLSPEIRAALSTTSPDSTASSPHK
jgi:hypothetical protein